MKSWHVCSLLAALALAACADEEPKPADAAPGEPNEPAPEPVEEPSWDGLQITGSVTSDLFGETLRLAAGAFGPAATPGVVHGGRELLAVDAAGNPLWRAGWSGLSSAPFASAHRVVDLTAIDVTDDGASDLLLVDNWGEMHLVDGADGTHLWKRQLAQDRVADGMAIFGEASDPLVYTSFSTGPIQVKTGAVAWQPQLPSAPVFVAALAQGTGEPSLAVATVEPTSGMVLQHDVFFLSPAGEKVAQFATQGFVTALATASFDEGPQVAVVGADQGRLFAVDADGTERWSATYPLGGDAVVAATYVERLLARDLDDDGVDEIVFTLAQLQRPDRTTLVVAEADGTERWRVLVGTDLGGLDVVGTGAGESLLVGLLSGGRELVVLEPGADEPVRWHFAATGRTTSHAAIDGKLFVGVEDGVFRRFDLATGTLEHEAYRGFFQLGAAVALGESIFVADEAGRLVARDLDGTLRWDVAPEDQPILPRALASHGAEGEEGLALLVLRFLDDGSAPGALHLLDQAGANVASVPMTTVPMAMQVGDLHGDGSEEAVVIGKNQAHIAAELVAIDLESGETRWESGVEDKCEFGFVDLSADTVGVGCFTTIAPPFVAAFEADGALRWKQIVIEQPHWVRLSGDALIAGGSGIDGEGFVAAYDAATGELRWQTALRWIPDPADPRRRIVGASWFGILVPDRTGDGVDEVAVTTAASDLLLLDGASGEAIWELPIRHEGVEHVAAQYGGALALVPATDEQPAWLHVGLGSWDGSDTLSMAVSLDGEAKGSFGNEGMVRAILPTTDEAGAPRTVVITSLGSSVHGLQAAP